MRRVLLADLPDGPLRERLAPIVEMRALTPVVRVRSRLLPVNVLDDEGKIVVRLQAEEPTVLAAPGPAEKLALRARLNVVGVRGYDGAFDRVLGAADRRARPRRGVAAGPSRRDQGDRRQARRHVVEAEGRAGARTSAPTPPP